MDAGVVVFYLICIIGKLGFQQGRSVIDGLGDRHAARSGAYLVSGPHRRRPVAAVTPKTGRGRVIAPLGGSVRGADGRIGIIDQFGRVKVVLYGKRRGAVTHSVGGDIGFVEDHPVLLPFGTHLHELHDGRPHREVQVERESQIGCPGVGVAGFLVVEGIFGYGGVIVGSPVRNKIRHALHDILPFLEIHGAGRHIIGKEV